MKINIIIIALASISSLGCKTIAADEVVNEISECQHRDRCVVSGLMSIEEINHVHMGELVTGKGECINISLPKVAVKKYSKRDKSNVMVAGVLYRTPVMQEDGITLQYKINGRRVGWGQCGDYYLFVDDVSSIRSLQER